MYRYYYTFDDNGNIDDYNAYCTDLDCAVECGKELESGGFWIVQYAEPAGAEDDDAPLSQCTFVGKIYIEN